MGGFASLFGGSGSGGGFSLTSLLGPKYDYSQYIKTPAEIGMGKGGSIGDVTADIGGLMAYISLIIDGGGEAQKPPYEGCQGEECVGLGAQGCGATMGKVKVDGKSVTRSLYYNYRPGGSGIMPSGMKGLLPGVLDIFSQISITQLIGALTGPATPVGINITLPCDTETNCQDNGPDKAKTCTGNFACADVMNMSDSVLEAGAAVAGTTAAAWRDTCQKAMSSEASAPVGEGFANYGEVGGRAKGELPDDPYIKAYYAALTLLALYIVMRHLYPDHT